MPPVLRPDWQVCGPPLIYMAKFWSPSIQPNTWVCIYMYIVDPKLNFNNHIDSITRKANCIRAFFSRNLCHTNQKVKEAVYTTFIRPTVEFAASSWDPHMQRNTKSRASPTQLSSLCHGMVISEEPVALPPCSTNLAGSHCKNGDTKRACKWCTRSKTTWLTYPGTWSRHSIAIEILYT